ncbi:peamaclein-like [Coffea eugenioides]|uniref:peamaclein-like n=1 Tax=Coffea eugenioides TaxID=49369 RepID=UPI000F5CB918|nr:peamaclein-like [Coffea arabica]XP_027162777.1 peamaclein-like [Coffea eugenioides]
MKRLFVAFLLIFALLLSNSFIEPTMGVSVYCTRECKARCAKAGVRDRCLRYCKICCGKCKCVPSGTHGNKHQCPCYRDMKNSKGKAKCP